MFHVYCYLLCIYSTVLSQVRCDTLSLFKQSTAGLNSVLLLLGGLPYQSCCGSKVWCVALFTLYLLNPFAIGRMRHKVNFGLNSEFFFFLAGGFANVKEPSLPDYFPTVEKSKWIHAFPKGISTKRNAQLYTIGSMVADSILYDDKVKRDREWVFETVTFINPLVVNANNVTNM